MIRASPIKALQAPPRRTPRSGVKAGWVRNTMLFGQYGISTGFIVRVNIETAHVLNAANCFIKEGYEGYGG
jgi:hypothetical protein